MKKNLCIFLSALLLLTLLPMGISAGYVAAPGVIVGENGHIVPSVHATITTFETGKTPTKTIYVDNHFDEGANGGNGTESNPYSIHQLRTEISLKMETNPVQPGTHIAFLPGTYTIHDSGKFIDITGLTGTAAAPIWIGGTDPNDRPVFQGGKEGVNLSMPKYVVLHDIVVTRSTENGVNINDKASSAAHQNDYTRASNVVVRNVYVHDIGALTDKGKQDNCDNFKFSGLNNYYVYDCEADNKATLTTTAGDHTSSGIDQVGCHYATIVGNYFHDMNGNAFQFKGGSHDADITGNLMVNAGARAVIMGGYSDLGAFRPTLPGYVKGQPYDNPDAFEAHNIRTYANIFVGGETPVAFVAAKNCTFIGNTVIRPDRYLMRILSEGTTDGGCRENTVSNNIFYYHSDEASEGVQAESDADIQPNTFTVENNLLYNIKTPGSSKSNFETKFPQRVNTVYADPLFTDVATGDYSLKKDSPAVGAGTTVSAVPTDFNGAAYKTPRSIGAIEYVVTAKPQVVSGSIVGTEFRKGGAPAITFTNTATAKSFTPTITDKTYTITLEPGTYTLSATKAYHTSFTLTGIVVADEPISQKIEVYAGLLTQDTGGTKVDIDCLILLLGKYKKAASALDQADINGDGIIDIDDLILLLGSYKKANRVAAWTL